MKKENTKQDYLYNIIEFWLSDEKYEYYLNSLFDTMPKIYELQDRPIIKLVLAKYQKSFEEELSKRSSTVSKEYYLNLFNKLYNSSFYKHNHDNELNMMIADLKQLLEKSKCKTEGKAYFYESINKLQEKPLEIDPLCKIEEFDLSESPKYLVDCVTSSLDNRKRVALDDNVVIFGNDNFSIYSYAYSVKYLNDKKTILRFHILDIASIIYEDTPLYSSLKNNNGLSEEIKKILSLKENISSPSLTLELIIDETGKVCATNAFKSIISPKAIINKSTPFNELKNENLTKPFVMVYKMFKKYYKFDYNASTLKDVGDTFNHILNANIGKTIANNNIPFIYKIQAGPNSKEVYNQINNLNSYLFYLDTDDYRKIYEIICNKNNARARYSTINNGHFGEHIRYKLDILKSFTYIGYSLQQVLIDLYINNLSYESLQAKYGMEFQKLVAYYNKKLYGLDDKLLEKPLIRKKIVSN